MNNFWKLAHEIYTTRETLTKTVTQIKGDLDFDL